MYVELYHAVIKGSYFVWVLYFRETVKSSEAIFKLKLLRNMSGYSFLFDFETMLFFSALKEQNFQATANS